MPGVLDRCKYRIEFYLAKAALNILFDGLDIEYRNEKVVEFRSRLYPLGLNSE